MSLRWNQQSHSPAFHGSGGSALATGVRPRGNEPKDGVRPKAPARFVAFWIETGPSSGGWFGGSISPNPPSRPLLLKSNNDGSVLRPRSVRGRRKVARLCACRLPPPRGHGAVKCFRTHAHR